jgi:hypothetical protein
MSAQLLAMAILLQPHNAIAAATERAPTLEEIQILFDRLTKPVPSRLHLRASQDIVERPWTEQQIDESLSRQEEHVAHQEYNYPKEKKEQIHNERRKKIREQFSGRRHLEYEMWIDGRLYRHNEKTTQDTNSLWDFSFVNIGDPTFTNIPSYSVNYVLNSVILDSGEHQYAEVPLWQALTTEAEWAMPFILSVLDTNSIRNPLTNSIPDCLYGYHLDSKRAMEFIQGKSPHFSISIRDEIEAGEQMSVFTMQGKAQPSKLELWIDLKRPYNLARVVWSNRHFTYESLRSAYDKNGFPREWTRITKAEKESSTNRIRYTEADINPDFDTWQIFAPHFPTNWHIAKLNSQGIGEVVQRPNTSLPVEYASEQPRPGREILVTTIVALLFAPIILMVWKRRKS